MSRAVSMLTQPRECGAVSLNPGAPVLVVHVARGVPAAHRVREKRERAKGGEP